MLVLTAENQTTNRMYWVATTFDPVQVVCEIQDDLGWTVIMRRTKMDVSFDKNWTDYRDGFGEMSGRASYTCYAYTSTCT